MNDKATNVTLQFDKLPGGGARFCYLRAGEAMPERGGFIAVRSRTGKIHKAGVGGPQHCNTRYGAFSTSGALSLDEVQRADEGTFCSKCWGAPSLAARLSVTEYREPAAAEPVDASPVAQAEPAAAEPAAACPDCDGTGNAPADRPAGVPPLCNACKGEGTTATTAPDYGTLGGFLADTAAGVPHPMGYAPRIGRNGNAAARFVAYSVDKENGTPWAVASWRELAQKPAWQGVETRPGGPVRFPDGSMVTFMAPDGLPVEYVGGVDAEPGARCVRKDAAALARARRDRRAAYRNARTADEAEQAAESTDADFLPLCHCPACAPDPSPAVLELLGAAEFAAVKLSEPGAPTKPERDEIIARLRSAIARLEPAPVDPETAPATMGERLFPGCTCGAAARGAFDRCRCD